MNCDISKELLVSYFYDEMVDEEKTEFENHLAHCSTCQSELEMLGQTTGALKVCPDEEPHLDLHFIQERTGILSVFKPKLPTAVWARTAFGLTASVAVVLLLLALVNFEAGYSNGDFSMRVSFLPRPDTVAQQTENRFTEPVSRREFENWKMDTYRLIENVVTDVEFRQRNENQATLTRFARDVEAQRRQDLQFLGRGFETLQVSSENRFRETDAILNELILQARSTRNPRSKFSPNQ